MQRSRELPHIKRNSSRNNNWFVFNNTILNKCRIQKRFKFHAFSPHLRFKLLRNVIAEIST
jgi:hypothetical protein